MKSKTLTYYKGTVPLTNKDIRRQKARQRHTKRIDAQNENAEICLSCEKPVKDCKGNCTCFKNVYEVKQP